MIIICICGFLMALADSVPGVSGGTIAYLLGCYEDFIGSLNSFLTFKGEISERSAARKKSIFFLLKLGTGWIIGFILAMLIITSVFESHIYKVSSLFLGFIAFSIPFIIYEERETLKKYYNALYIIVGAAVVVAITMANIAILDSADNAAADKTGFYQLLYLAFAGMVAISGMVLPGISGATILLIFGVYNTITSSVKQLFVFDFSVLPTIIAAGTGIVVGAVLIIKLIKGALDRFHSQTIYTIIGLMIGSLYAIIEGPLMIKENPQPAMTFNSFSILFFIIGGAVIAGLQLLKLFFSKKEAVKKES